MTHERIEKVSSENSTIQKKHSYLTPRAFAVQTKSSLSKQPPKVEPVRMDWKQRDRTYQRLVAQQAVSERLSANSSTVDTSVQMKCSQCESEAQVQAKTIQSDSFLPQTDALEEQQAQQGPKSEEKSIQQVAAEGFSGSPTTLPYQAQIQQSFGRDLSGVQAYIGGPAAIACQRMGAYAYASGDKIAFKEQPNLELAAHEAAHIRQQESGQVQLSGGVGQVGDKYEQHADAVAARVGGGQSASALLAEYANPASEPVQEKASDAVCNQSTKSEKDPVIQHELSSISSLQDQPNTGELNEIENLHAEAGVFDRPPRPSSNKPPNPNNCRQIMMDMLTYLIGGTLSKVVSKLTGKTVTRSIPERYGQLKSDFWRLYRRGSTGVPGIGTWKGHIDVYNQMRKDLKNLRNQWKNGNCDNWDGGDPDVLAAIRTAIEAIDYWLNQEPPDKPDNADLPFFAEQQQNNSAPSFSMPTIELPNWDFLWLIPRLLEEMRQRT